MDTVDLTKNENRRSVAENLYEVFCNNLSMHPESAKERFVNQTASWLETAVDFGRAQPERK